MEQLPLCIDPAQSITTARDLLSVISRQYSTNSLSLTLRSYFSVVSGIKADERMTGDELIYIRNRKAQKVMCGGEW